MSLCSGFTKVAQQNSEQNVCNYLFDHNTEFNIPKISLSNPQQDASNAISALQKGITQRKNLEYTLSKILEKAGITNSISDVYTNPDSILNQLFLKLDMANNNQALTNENIHLKDQFVLCQHSLDECHNIHEDM